MGNSWYSFDVAPGWVLLAIIVAFGLALLLYSRRETPWGKTMNILMGFLRFAALFLILLLLLNPLLQLNVNHIDKPLVILALDNSESVRLRSGNSDSAAIAQWLENTKTNLSDYEVKTEYLEPPTDSALFLAKTTNLGKKLKNIESAYDDQNVGAVVLLSDGIINEGQSPAYQSYSFPVYTVGLGDTIAPKDIAIQNVRSNKVAYQGNQFPISVVLHQKGFDNTLIKINISESGRILAEKTERFTTNNKSVEFQLNADSPGLRRLTVAAEKLEGESSYANNEQDLYIDVVEGKDKVLILAPAPHPDIHTIRAALNESSNYETVLYIPGIGNPPKEKQYDLIVEHQAFSGSNYGSQYTSSGKLYILGEATRISQVGPESNFLKITQKGSQEDKVRGSYNKSFSKFKLDESLTDRLANYPPLSVPYGDYELTGPSETLLYQQIGSIVTQKPLIAFSDDGSEKLAVMVGSGFWQWKVQEAAQEERAEFMSELIQKTVQYLCIKVNKDRFIVKPREASYQVGDRIFIDTEVYNEIYERAYDNKIQLSIANDAGVSTNYELVDSPVNSAFNVGSMPAGIYTFKATTQSGGKTFTETGSFAVRDLQLESINLTANHNLLKSLSKNTKGEYFSFDKANELASVLQNENFKSRIRTNREKFPLINSIWIILLIALLLGTEWFLRKYLGAY